MRIVFTHNLQLRNTEEEAEFDRPETVAAIAEGLRRAGHEVEPLDVSGPASRLVARLEALNPELVFNTAEGNRGRFREGFYPALFDQLAIPYTGSDAYVCTATLDKQFTKLVLSAHGIPTPQWKFVDDVRQIENHGLRFPVIVKPNFEGSSMGITADSVVEDDRALRAQIESLLQRYPAGALVEEFIVGRDLVVPFLEGASPATGGILEPAVYDYNPAFVQGKFQIYDYAMKTTGFDAVTVKAPADIPSDVRAKVIEVSQKVFRILGVRDAGRCDYRITDSGEFFFLEMNALPSLEQGASLFLCGALAGLTDEAQVLDAIVKSAADRQGLSVTKLKGRRRRNDLRIGLAFSRSVSDATGGEDVVQAVRNEIESFGHSVVDLEATPELPSILPASGVDFVFNMARGVHGRRRESQVPALLELLDIEFVGSDSTAMAFAFDKPLSKKLVAEAGIHVPKAVLLTGAKDKLPADLNFPIILKAQSSLPGVQAEHRVVTDKVQLREVVAEVISARRQPLVAESYIEGREFVIGLIGERRPKVLPAMEVIFPAGQTHPILSDLPVRVGVRYQVPAEIDPGLARLLSRAAKAAFTVLGCRDLARVVLRLTPDGKIYFLACTPLPNLTPEISDLSRIAQAAGIDYHSLVGDIMSPAMRRLKERRGARFLGARG